MRTPTIVCCVLALAVCTASSQPGWITSFPAAANKLHSIYFIDTTHGWVVGEHGLINFSTNGGVAWSPQTSGTAKDLYCVRFTDAHNGWVVGDTVLHTTNGGTTWSAQTIGMRKQLHSVYFTDANNGWAVGETGTVLHTTNGGANWAAQTSNTTQYLYSVQFADSLKGWAVGWSGTILRTTNGGTTWTVKTLPLIGQLNSVQFIDANNGWIAASGTIFHTTDGGTTWPQQQPPTSPPPPDYSFYCVFFVDAYNGWISSGAGGILHTADGGSTWTNQAGGGNGMNWAIQMYNANIGWMVGDYYVFYTKTGGVIVSVEEPKTNGLPQRYALAQNFPNPFNPCTTISYSLLTATSVSLRIFNTLGQEVASLVNERKDAGSYLVQWNATVPSGIYFYRLQAGEYLETKKMILLK
jgi:photosystem II stability/assembly factor-like uncharacterized protein